MSLRSSSCSIRLVTVAVSVLGRGTFVVAPHPAYSRPMTTD